LERKVYREWLCVKAPNLDADALRAFWDGIPRTLHRDPSLLQCYIPLLIKKSDMQCAEELIRDAMKKQWDSSLIYYYGLVTTEDHSKQLATAEIWLKSQPHDPVLLLTLGRLCIQNQLWGKARSYLEYSLEIDPKPETCQVLGDLLIHLNEQEAAAKYYQRGLALAIAHDKTHPNIR
jgi:HemY protein